MLISSFKALSPNTLTLAVRASNTHVLAGGTVQTVTALGWIYEHKLDLVLIFKGFTLCGSSVCKQIIRILPSKCDGRNIQRTVSF